MLMDKWGSKDPQDQYPNPHSDANQTRGSKGKSCTTPLFRNPDQRHLDALDYLKLYNKHPIMLWRKMSGKRRVLLHDEPVKNTPTHIHKNEEDARSLCQHWTYKPALSAGDGFLDRLKRNAWLVAAGVAKNVNRVCKHIKESLDENRRPK